MNKIEIVVLGFDFIDFDYHNFSKQDVISNVVAATIRKSNPTVIDITISSTANLKPCGSIKISMILAIKNYYEEFTSEMVLSLIEYAGQNSLQAYRLYLKKHCGFVPMFPEITINDILPRISVNESTIDPLSN